MRGSPTIAEHTARVDRPLRSPGAEVRIAVIGDVGGHIAELTTELERLGVRRHGNLPPDLTIVQVGDLVHRGPDSDAVLALVDKYLESSPDRWVQLIGNHEANYIRPAAFKWPDPLTAQSSRTVRAWWASRKMTAAAAIETSGDSFLVTHAGLTAGFWSGLLDAPASAEEAARRINRLAAAGDDSLFRPGWMLTGKVSAYAGPLWADRTRELVPGWLDRQMPFSQIHGHSTISNWRDPQPLSVFNPHAVVTIDFAAKHETVWNHGRRLIAIDPGHLAEPTTPWRALELNGVVVSP